MTGAPLTVTVFRAFMDAVRIASGSGAYPKRTVAPCPVVKPQ